jgi:hypothetical protein
MTSLPASGTRVRARVLDWALCQENDKLEFPDPRLPTLQGVPEWVDGPLDVRHVTAPWGEYDSITVEWEGRIVAVEAETVEVAVP